MSERFDIAIVGSGFAGSILAMITQKIGLRTVLIERGTHPRFVIGESSTPLSNLLLEELTIRYDLPNLRPLSKWGSWRGTHPELACGLKRGFSFFRHDSPSGTVISRENQLLVAASPYDEIADTHWYRADLDAYLVREAQCLGATYFDEVDLQTFSNNEGGALLHGTRHDHPFDVTVRFVVDATGPRGFLHRVLKLGERVLPDIPQTQALYSHFTNVHRLEETNSIALDGRPPYPVDDAAVHHIFDQGWVWVLRFCNGVTSAGIAAHSQLATELKLHEGHSAWQRVMQRAPVLQQLFADAQPIQPYRYTAQLAFHSESIRGRNWALLPSAAGFVDPLLSTGFPLTLLGISRLAKILEQDWNTHRFDMELQRYAAKIDAELLVTSRLIGALYENLDNFPTFAALTLLYFAAASYSETVRRLGHPELASSFLLYDHPVFGPECSRVLQMARSDHRASDPGDVASEVLRAIEPIDVAGLCNPERHNWHPVDPGDLLRAAHKVGATQSDILTMLEQCGFAPATSSQNSLQSGSALRK